MSSSGRLTGVGPLPGGPETTSGLCQGLCSHRDSLPGAEKSASWGDLTVNVQRKPNPNQKNACPAWDWPGGHSVTKARMTCQVPPPAKGSSPPSPSPTAEETLWWNPEICHINRCKHINELRFGVQPCQHPYQGSHPSIGQTVFASKIWL